MANADESEPADWKVFFRDRMENNPQYRKFRTIEKPSVLFPWLDSLEYVEAKRLSPTTGRLVVRFAVQQQYLNPSMTLQGGLQVGMYDILLSEVFAFAKNWAPISSNLNTSYFRPAYEGEYLLMESEIVHAGKALGFSRGSLRREKDGALISSCEHHLYNLLAHKAKM